MDPSYTWNTCASDTGTERSSDEFAVNTGSRARTGNGSSSYSSLVLDSERGELVEANVRLQKKGVSVERSVAALKNHIEAERKRRKRINGHLDTLRTLLPGAKKYDNEVMILGIARFALNVEVEISVDYKIRLHMDKATLLTEVVSRLKELQKNATEGNEGFLIPTDIDEVKVERQDDGSDGAPHSIRASLCCDYKPGLLSNLRQSLGALHLILVKAEIVTLGDRMKNVLVMAICKDQNIENAEVCQSLLSSVHQAFRSVLNKFSASEEFLLGARLSSKRRRVSLCHLNQ
ncbi:hypothetical protein EZV62_020308 [Acer yangbiense]|uniref:BHLH domain-containing protein n=1 Tax=Acer yangbiense TaxID=1000413 RepID=A0A5C7HF23_9ROSI|nr:hypothetical protein EZV62_020308 [Acer yangbiense]